MHRPSPKARPDADLIHRLPASLLRSNSFISEAQACCRSSYRKVRSRKWCTLQSTCWHRNCQYDRQPSGTLTPWKSARMPADSVQRRFAPFAMDGVVGQLLRRTDMHPVALACYLESCFILMQHLCPTERSFNLVFHRLQLRGTALDQPLQGAHAHRGSQQVLDHFTGALIRQQLRLDQIDAHCSKRRSLLHRRSHVFGERRAADLLTTGAALLLRLVFDHHHALGRQIQHLAAFHGQALHLAQFSLTVLAVFDRVNDHRIGRLRQLQGVSCMTGLASGLLAASRAQALGLPMKAIRGGRKVAVVTVLLELFLQCLHLLVQKRDLLLHLGTLFISLRQLL